MRDLIKIIEGAQNFGGSVAAEFTTNYKDTPCVVLKNPTINEVMKIRGVYGNVVRAFVIEDGILIWNIDTALHQNVREYLKLPNDAIPIILYFDFAQKECLVTVTDNSEETKWWHNPAVVEELETASWLKKYFTSIEVSFYDENIVGNWQELSENAEPSNVVVILKGIGPKWKDVFIDGVKVGFISREWQDVAVGLHGGTRGSNFKKMQLWTGEFMFDGNNIFIGRTEKASDLKPKVEKLIRSYLVRKAASKQD